MNSKIMASAGAGILAVILFVLYVNAGDAPMAVPEDAQAGSEIMVTNGMRHLIPLEKIRSGGPPQDGIPSIDDPKFASATDAGHVSDDDTVIGLEIAGDARAYPLYIMVWHEIVNDNVGQVPVSVTYCPLCYTSQVFERVLDGEPVEFGTSGKLYNSNLLMYDRQTGSYWSQALGLAVTGELTGRTLKIIPFDLISWGDWKKIHPDSLVLTTQTGHVRAYGVDPYGDYYTAGEIFFPVENDDDRLYPKDVIVGLYADDTHKAYLQSDLREMIITNDSVGHVPVLLVSMFEGNARVFERTLDGKTLEFELAGGKIVDQTGSEWDYDGMSVSGPHEGRSLERIASSPGFWFEWAAFHPDTLLYGES